MVPKEVLQVGFQDHEEVRRMGSVKDCCAGKGLAHRPGPYGARSPVRGRLDSPSFPFKIV